MTSQLSEEGREFINSQNQQDGTAIAPPEIHGDTASPLSEQEEAQKEDHEYKKLTDVQEEMYEKIQKIRPGEELPGMGDVSQSGISRSLHESIHHNEKRTKTDDKQSKKPKKEANKGKYSGSKEEKKKEKKGTVSDSVSLNDSSGHIPIVNEANGNSKQGKVTEKSNPKAISKQQQTKKSSGIKVLDKIKGLHKKSHISRRSTNVKATKKSSLKPEKEKHQKGGRKNVVIVNRPPILYHPPPEIYHRPPIVLHRPPILVQRPAIVYHQPPVIVHRPAVLYRQPPLVFHQPPPVVSQPMLHSHDMFATKPSLQHVNSRVIPAGTLFGLPPASRWSPNAQTVVDSQESLGDTGSVLDSHDDSHHGGGVVLLGQGRTRTIALGNNDEEEDDNGEDTAGEQKSGIPKAAGKKSTKASKKGSLRKLRQKTKREAPKNEAITSSPETVANQNSTKRSETAKATDIKQGKKGTKKDVVVNRPPIIYHPPPEIYHRPDIVIHRPPIVIHRPPIIYHQPPVIVHRPAVVYHQPPIVFHQPPPAVQQPLLYSHDTFVVHPSFVAQHLGSILRTAHHYVGPPRLLTHLGQPLFDGEHTSNGHSYPQETHSFDFSHMGGEESEQVGGHHGLGILGHLGGEGQFGRYGEEGQGLEGHFGGESSLGGGHLGGFGQFGGEGHFGGGESQFGGEGHIGGESFLGNGFARENVGGGEGDMYGSDQQGGFIPGGGATGFGGQFGGGISKRSRVERAKKRADTEGTVKYQDIASTMVVQHQEPIHVYQNNNEAGHGGFEAAGHGGYVGAGHGGFEAAGHGGYEAAGHAGYLTGNYMDTSHPNGVWNTMLTHENAINDVPDATHIHQEIHDVDGPVYHTAASDHLSDGVTHAEQGTPTHIVQASQQIVQQPIVYHQDPPTVMHPVYHEVESPSGHSTPVGYVPDEGSATHYVHYHPLTIHHHHIHHFHILKPEDEDRIDDEPVHVHHKHIHKHKLHHFDIVTDHDPTVKKKSVIRRSPDDYQGTLTAF